MTAEIGTFLLILALMSSLLQAARPLALRAAWLQALLLTFAFATLILLRLDDDFTVANVAEHSNLALPVLYKITGAWGNHEGSMLLWVWVLSLYGLGIAAAGRLEPGLQSRALAVQGMVGAGFLLFILFTSNPFARLFPAPADGAALNPLLQDVGLAIHPPMLYGGYVGFSIVYAFAIAALWQGRLDAAWARTVHPWLVFSWGLLTLGIGLGSWWAYRELGWGGWWFWDPVENASLLPWLTGTALLHANLVLARRGLLARWVALLAIVTFGFSLLGTFLVRSGVLTSVHSFASDPARGMFILGYIVLVTGGGLALYGLRLPHVARSPHARFLSREGMIVVNNLLLLVACATVTLGTLYPVFSELAGEKISVGPPYFNQTFLPLMVLPLLFAAIAVLTPWKRANTRRLLRALRLPLLVSINLALLTLALTARDMLLAAFGFGLAGFLAIATLMPFLRRLRQHGFRLPAPLYGVTLAHLGAALLVAGITGHGLLSHHLQQTVKPGDTLTLGAYTLTYEGLRQETNPNYTEERATLRLGDATLTPSLRTYSTAQTQTTEAAIHATPMRDIYAVLGHAPGGAVTLRLYDNPMISFIWLGCVLMTLGGLIPAFAAWRR